MQMQMRMCMHMHIHVHMSVFMLLHVHVHIQMHMYVVMLIDVVVSSPYAGGPEFRAACARRDGHACRRAAIAKRQRYPTEDLVPFAVETGGRLGADARALLARMAQAAEEPDREIQYLQRAVSSILQDGVARQLL